MAYEDVLYETDGGVATVTINRPKVMNAFRSLTVEELVDAFKEAWADRGVGAVALRGLALYYGTEEAAEGKNAFLAKRKPNFAKYRS